MREDMLGYVSTVPGIGVGTGVFILWTKRMPGVDRYDPPGRLCHCPEPIECRDTLSVLIGRRAMLSSLVYAI